MLWEDAVDERLAEVGEREQHCATVVLEAAAGDEVARLERRHDLGRVGLRPAKPAPEGSQLELAAGGREDDQHGEPGDGQLLALELSRYRAPDGRLGAHERLERAMRERVADLERGSHRREG